MVYQKMARQCVPRCETKVKSNVWKPNEEKLTTDWKRHGPAHAAQSVLKQGITNKHLQSIHHKSALLSGHS
jgi:hypothetical protein